MIKKLLFLIPLILFGISSLQGQIISGKIIDARTFEPLKDVAIKTNLNFGTTSDENGKFVLEIDNATSITFSYLSYHRITLTIDQLKIKKFVVKLNEKVNELDEIQLNLAKISLDSILIKTQKSMKQNYLSSTFKHDFYSREHTAIYFDELDLELKKSTLLSKSKKQVAEKELAEFSKRVRLSKPSFSSEYIGVLDTYQAFSKKMNKNYNVNRIEKVQGIQLSDNKKNSSIKEVQNKLQLIVLKNLNKNISYKVSSGLFPIEDSLSLKKVIDKSDSLQLNNKTFKQYKSTNLINSARNKGELFKTNDEKNFLNQKYYEHHFDKNVYLGEQMVYVVQFEPRKSKSKFSGEIYINPKDYTISKIEYKYADGKRGQHLNLKFLMGVKFSENERNGIIYYDKNTAGKSYISYFKERISSYAYVNRPIKFKENTSEKNKIKFNIKIELETISTNEILFTKITEIDKSEIKKMNKEDFNKNIPYTSIENYKNSDWKNRQKVIAYLQKWE